MLNNRDSCRVNKANKAIQACLLGKIHIDTLSHLQRTNNGEYEKDMLDFAIRNCEKMTEHFCSSQESISTTSCMQYARNQHRLISKAVKNKEDINNIMSISKYVVDSSLLKVYDQFNKMTSTGKYLKC